MVLEGSECCPYQACLRKGEIKKVSVHAMSTLGKKGDIKTVAIQEMSVLHDWVDLLYGLIYPMLVACD